MTKMMKKVDEYLANAINYTGAELNSNTDCEWWEWEKSPSWNCGYYCSNKLTQAIGQLKAHSVFYHFNNGIMAKIPTVV